MLIVLGWTKVKSAAREFIQDHKVSTDRLRSHLEKVSPHPVSSSPLPNYQAGYPAFSRFIVPVAAAGPSPVQASRCPVNTNLNVQAPLDCSQVIHF